MRSPARQLGRVSGAPTNAAFALIGVVEDGTSFHASFQAFMHPLKDGSARKQIFWGSFLNINIAVGQGGTIAAPNVPSAAAFSLDTPPEVDRICPRGISARGRLVPTSKFRHLKKADEGQA
jgi:hypothetical protein